MASAIFLNATLFRISLNLNSELQNQILEPMSTTPGDQAEVQLPGWPAPIEKYPNSGVFGGNDYKNVLVVFSELSPEFKVYEISSTVSTAEDLYLYVMGEDVTGADQSGSTEGIVVTPASDEVAAEVLRRVPAPTFHVVPPS